MEKIFKTLLDKYNNLLLNLIIGYPLDKESVSELMCLIHILHFVGFDKDNSKECLEILAYYV